MCTKWRESMGKTELIQSPEQPVAAEVLAQNIIDIDKSMKAALAAGLKVNTIVTLVAADTGLAKRDVRAVIDSLSTLRSTWTTK
jgi:hypothetical protein